MAAPGLANVICDAASMTDDLTRQLEMNRETWAALRDADVAAGQTLGVDAFFFAPDEASATALASDLASLGWRTDLHASTQGLLKKRTLWSVQGSRVTTATGVDVSTGWSANSTVSLSGTEPSSTVGVRRLRTSADGSD